MTAHHKRRDTAVALKYRTDSEDAPKVIAKGHGVIAEKIRELARQNNVPIQQDADLVELLAEVDLDREITAELYAAVAELLSWIYRANAQMRKDYKI